ncbi:DUF3450 family protein [Alteromonas sp. ASW11-130]|uniref:DUF3450 family protein n=1 Tax=Alteromonas sp. ASW11-130 TaxID=3015775 RepID=UPI0022421D5E|nr:DUF3450 domain-containing protein [Alteromonas sp. ASW11-130]
MDNKLQQFKILNKEVEGFEVYNTQLKKQLNSQKQEMSALNAAIDEVSVVERQIRPSMIRRIDSLLNYRSNDNRV